MSSAGRFRLFVQLIYNACFTFSSVLPADIIIIYITAASAGSLFISEFFHRDSIFSIYIDAFHFRRSFLSFTYQYLRRRQVPLR